MWFSTVVILIHHEFWLLLWWQWNLVLHSSALVCIGFLVCIKPQFVVTYSSTLITWFDENQEIFCVDTGKNKLLVTFFFFGKLAPSNQFLAFFPQLILPTQPMGKTAQRKGQDVPHAIVPSPIRLQGTWKMPFLCISVATWETENKKVVLGFYPRELI